MSDEITMDVLNDANGVTTTQWKDASKSVIKEAISAGRVQFAKGDDNKLGEVSGFFYQLKDNRLNDDKNPEKLLPWAVCSKQEKHVFKLSFKYTAKGFVGSFTNTQLHRHPCYKTTIKKKSGGLTKEEKSESRNVLKHGAASAVIQDLRPFSFTKGGGIFEYTKSAISVGVKLGRMPTDKDLHKIIPQRGAIKRKVFLALHSLRSCSQFKSFEHKLNRSSSINSS